MSSGSLKTKIWVQALVRRSEQVGNFAAVLRRGAPEAGAILVKVLRPGGACGVLTQVRTAEGEPAWMWGTGPEPVAESLAEAYIERQIGYDEDLWVVEIDAHTAEVSARHYPMFDRFLIN